MTDADLLRIAQECSMTGTVGAWCAFDIAELHAFADRIRAETIAECAKVCDERAEYIATAHEQLLEQLPLKRHRSLSAVLMRTTAAAIRALGEAR